VKFKGTRIIAMRLILFRSKRVTSSTLSELAQGVETIERLYSCYYGCYGRLMKQHYRVLFRYAYPLAIDRYYIR